MSSVLTKSIVVVHNLPKTIECKVGVLVAVSFSLSQNSLNGREFTVELQNNHDKLSPSI